VQKVMANALMYAPRLGQSAISMKSRMGVIPGKNKPQHTMAEPVDE
jgi:soluble lytic murein transglycosylase